MPQMSKLLFGAMEAFVIGKDLVKKIKVHECNATHLHACTIYAHCQQSNAVNNL